MSTVPTQEPSGEPPRPATALICRVGERRLAIPLEHVVEVFRPLPVQRVADAPASVLGVAVVRGAPAPVLDLARLLGLEGVSPGRFVSLRVAGRRVVIAVEGVEGLHELPPGDVHALPPLLAGADDDVVAALAARDRELVSLLGTARLLREAGA